MLVILLAASLAAIVLALLGLVLTFTRIARNAGLLDLEDYARRKGCVYIPISTQLVDDLGEWSKPVQLKLTGHEYPLLVELQIKQPEN